MFDTIAQIIRENPYLTVAALFLLCGMGLPLPEEIVLLAGGYVCAKFPDVATLHWMIIWSAGAILSGDLLPYILGRTFGTRLLRLRWMRLMVTKQRLAKFDRWFRRRGDLVIFIARFLAGIRMVAFFTAGTMKMRITRFLLLDGLGIVLIVPLLVWVGYQGAGIIDDVYLKVQKIERGLLWSAGACIVLAALWLWWRSGKRRRRLRAAVPKETFVEPRIDVAGATTSAQPAGPDAPAAAAPAPAADRPGSASEAPPDGGSGGGSSGGSSEV
jgi:membrane protein DedA with SNARE-associated domain